MKNTWTKHPKKILTLMILTLVGCFFIAWKDNTPIQTKYHSDAEMVKMLNGNLPIYDNGYFVGSGRCGGCHGIDPVGYASITQDGELVSPTENWRGTMMANAAKDPFWRAKLSHEMLINPSHAQDLVNKCTSCHAPIGKYTNALQGNPNYDITQLPNDSMALDGVNCSVCHQQRMETLGQHFSGELNFHTDTIWGPYVSEEQSVPIFYQAMQSFVGYTPVGNHKVKKSEFCAGCHTLSTHTANLSGNYTGQTFIEQATYHEWLNSSYKNSNDPIVHKECQDCHMPKLNEPIVLASGYSFLTGRQPYGQHWLVGGNYYMLELLRNNIDALHLTANAMHFNTVLSRTQQQLTQSTAQLQLSIESMDADTAKFSVHIKNLAGHKFPSGYPARRAFVEFVVTDDNGNEMFRSGGVDANQRVIGEDATFEPHHNIISQSNQVQIYEMVMGDVNGNKTNVLERAASMIKDNRLTPLGFSSQLGGLSDTTQIVGIGDDPDFNFENNAEGSGTDIIHFHLPIGNWLGNFHVSVRLLYQSAPPQYMDEMFAFDSPEINTFRSMYNQLPPVPFEVAHEETQFTSINNHTSALPTIFPNPTYNGHITISNFMGSYNQVDVYSNDGKWLFQQRLQGKNSSLILPDSKGVYLLVLKGEWDRKVIRVVRQ